MEDAFYGLNSLVNVAGSTEILAQPMLTTLAGARPATTSNPGRGSVSTQHTGKRGNSLPNSGMEVPSITRYHMQ